MQIFLIIRKCLANTIVSQIEPKYVRNVHNLKKMYKNAIINKPVQFSYVLYMYSNGDTSSHISTSFVNIIHIFLSEV